MVVPLTLALALVVVPRTAALPSDPAGSATVTRLVPAGAPPYGQAGGSLAMSGDLLVLGAPGAGSGTSGGNQVYLLRRPGPAAPHVPEATLVPEAEPEWNAFGHSVAASGDLVAVGAPNDDAQGNSAGATYLFRRGTSGGWQQIARLYGSNSAAGDRFGHSVALGPLGPTTYRMIVGAPLEGNAQGAAYVFSISLLGTPTVVEETRLTGQIVPFSARLGSAVSVHGDVVAAGAPRDSQAGTDAGAVYVFTRSGTAWSQTSKVIPTDAGAGQLFGSSVAVAGPRLAVGAPRHAAAGNLAGAAYVFANLSGIWTQQERYLAAGPGEFLGSSVDLRIAGAYFLAVGGDGVVGRAVSNGTTWPAALTRQLAPDGVAGNNLGGAVAVSADTLAAGARRDDDEGFLAGAGYVFDTGSTPWPWTKHLPTHAGEDEAFGNAIAVDGGVAVVGAREDDDLLHEGGAAYVLERTGGAWTQAARLDAGQHARPYAFFGTAVDVRGDTVVAGAPMEGLDTGGTADGAAYVFRGGGASWSLEARLAFGTGARFGEAVALEDDLLLVGIPGLGGAIPYYRQGTTWSPGPDPHHADAATNADYGAAVALRDGIAVIGAPRFDVSGANDAGAAYVFQQTGSTWTFRQKLLASVPQSGAFFGASLDIDDDRIVVGAPLDDANGINAGAVYTFRRTGPAAWAFESSILPVGTSTTGRFGSSVDVDGYALAIGARFEDTTATDAGAAFVYRFQGFLWTRDLWFPGAGLLVGDERGAACAWSSPTELLVGTPGRDGVYRDSGALEVWNFAPGDILYCTGKTNSLGCVPFMTLDGRASASDTAPFRLGAWSILPGESGLLLYGFTKGNLDFHGGKLCVKLPFHRLFPLQQAPPFGPPPCTGMLERNFNKRIQGGADPLLTPGQRVLAQWRLRDPSDPAGFGDGFTDAVRFTICP